MTPKKPNLLELRRRYHYHPPHGDQAERYAKVRDNVFACAAACVMMTPACDEQDRALDALDQAMFLFNAAIARNEPELIGDRAAPPDWVGSQEAFQS